MATVDEIKIIVKAEVDEAVANLTQLNTTTGKTETAFGKMRDIMQGPIAAFQEAARVVGAATAAFDSLIMAAANAEQSQAVLGAILRATGADAWTSMQKLNKYSEEMARRTLFEDDAITSMQGVLLGFRNIAGPHYKEASDAILDMSQVMGMDLVSAAQAVGKALDMPVQGMDALSRQGFRFTDSEKAMIKSLVEAGKTAEAQDIILKELTKTFGGAAEAATKTSTGGWQQAKKALGEMKEAAGGGAAEAIEGLAQSFAEGGFVIAEAMNEATKEAKVADLVKEFIGGASATEVQRKLDTMGVPYFNFLADLYSAQAKAIEGSTSMIWNEAKRKAFEEQKRAIDEAIEKWDEYGRAQKRVLPEKGRAPMSSKSNPFQVGKSMEGGVFIGEVEEYSDAINELSETQRKQYDSAIEGYYAMSEALGAALVSGEDGWKAFGKAGLNAIAGVVEAMAIEADELIAGAIAQVILGDYKKVPGIGAAIAASVSAHAAAGAIRAIPMAEGGSGIVTKPTLFLAGEAGPEPYAFGGANNKLGMGGSTYNYYIAGSVIREREVGMLGASQLARAGRGY
jgi:hypothetical protein